MGLYATVSPQTATKIEAKIIFPAGNQAVMNPAKFVFNEEERIGLPTKIEGLLCCDLDNSMDFTAINTHAYENQI